MIISLGVDPGTANYAYGFVRYKLIRGKLRPRILSCGQLHWTISNLTDGLQRPPKNRIKKSIPVKDQMIPPFQSQLSLFEKDWRAQVRKFQPNTWTVERFQARGLMGKTIECVSLMNGVLAAMARRNKIYYGMITAAQWKNRVNAFDELDVIYKEVSLPPHVVDACFISTYSALKHFKLDWSKQVVHSMVDQLAALEYKKS